MESRSYAPFHRMSSCKLCIHEFRSRDTFWAHTTQTHARTWTKEDDRKEKRWTKFSMEIAPNGCYVLALGITATDLVMMMMAVSMLLVGVSRAYTVPPPWMKYKLWCTHRIWIRSGILAGIAKKVLATRNCAEGQCNRDGRHHIIVYYTRHNHLENERLIIYHWQRTKTSTEYLTRTAAAAAAVPATWTRALNKGQRKEFLVRNLSIHATHSPARYSAERFNQNVPLNCLSNVFDCGLRQNCLYI